MEWFLWISSRGASVGWRRAFCERDGAEAQRIHHRDRPRAHSEDVAQDSADAGGRALERLDERRVVVRFDLERAGPAVADVDDAGVLSRALHDALAARGQPLQVDARGFVGAVLAPHHAEDAEFGQGGLASAQKLADFLVFVERESVLPDGFRGKGRGQRGRHGGVLLSHFEPRR